MDIRRVEERLREYRQNKEEINHNKQNKEQSIVTQLSHRQTYNLISTISNSYLFICAGQFRKSNPQIFIVLVAIVWLIGLVTFIWIQFGCVYFACSLLVFILISMRSEPRKPGEMSAYSVFNPNCERLAGQMTAEHFENELLRRNLPKK